MKSLQVLLLALSPLAGFSSIQAADPIAYTQTASTSDTIDIEKLANAGISQEVMLAFVEGSPVAYDLNSDEILRLENMAVPDAVIVAMIDHGKSLRGDNTSAATQPVSDPAINTAYDNSSPISTDNIPSPADVT